MTIEKASSKRVIVASLILIMSILLITVLPFLVPGMLEEMEGSQKIRNEQLFGEFEPQEAQLVTTMRTMGWSYPFLTALSMLAGFIILVTMKQYYIGKKWARALILVCFSIPSITGGYMIATYYHFLSFKVGFSPGFYFIIVGFIGYFTVLLLDIIGIKLKLLYIWTFTMLGILAAYIWANGITCHVILESNPAIPFYSREVFLTYITRNLDWIAIIFILVALYFIALKRIIGWYIAIIAVSSVTFIGFVMQTVRTDTHDFMYQGILGLLLLITLLLPSIKNKLFDYNID